jgi:hypothetical protein
LYRYNFEREKNIISDWLQRIFSKLLNRLHFLTLKRPNNSPFVDSLVNMERTFLLSLRGDCARSIVEGFESYLRVSLMNRKLVWLSILSIFFLIWGASGTVGASRTEFLSHSSIPGAGSTLIAPEATTPPLIPVTGNPDLGWGTLIIYGLIGFAALILILALLDSANQSTTLYARRKTPTDKADNQ